MSKVTVKQVTHKVVTIELAEQEAKVLNAALERTYLEEANSGYLVDLSCALDDNGIEADRTTFDESFIDV